MDQSNSTINQACCWDSDFPCHTSDDPGHEHEESHILLQLELRNKKGLGCLTLHGSIFWYLCLQIRDGKEVTISKRC